MILAISPLRAPRGSQPPARRSWRSWPPTFIAPDPTLLRVLHRNAPTGATGGPSTAGDDCPQRSGARLAVAQMTNRSVGRQLPFIRPSAQLQLTGLQRVTAICQPAESGPTLAFHRLFAAHGSPRLCAKENAMTRVQFVCRRCNHRFVKKVIEREEAVDRKIPTSPVRCENCGSTDVERR